MNGYCTLEAAYRLTGVTEDLIASAIQQGEIRAKTCTGQTVVVLTDVRDYRARLLSDRGCEACEE